MSQHLSFPRVWEGSRRTSQGQNRTREIRPSGIVGGPMETWVMGVGLRPGGKSPESPPNPKAVARHSSIPTAPVAPESPLQVVLPAKYDPKKRRRGGSKKRDVPPLQDEATRACNFHTAL